MRTTLEVAAHALLRAASRLVSMLVLVAAAIPAQNFAGHYVIVRWGCGSPCLMMAIVDLETGHVLPPPFHHGQGHSYFQLPWEFPPDPLKYKLDSRLLIANICESDKPATCGAHYFVMEDGALKLIDKVIDK